MGYFIFCGRTMRMHNPEILLDGKAANMVLIMLIITCVSQSKEDHYA